MATINKLPSGSWRVQVRRKGKYASETFLRQTDGKAWARAIETKIDRGEPILLDAASTKTFGGLIDLHKSDLAQVGKIYGRSKAASLEFLSTRLGKLRPSEMNREKLIEFGKQRAKEGAGPVTLSIDIDDLHFHDLRHEATSRLFEAGFSIEQVALVTGHKDWKMLRRYTHIRPEGLHAIAGLKAA